MHPASLVALAAGAVLLAAGWWIWRDPAEAPDAPMAEAKAPDIPAAPAQPPAPGTPQNPTRAPAVGDAGPAEIPTYFVTSEEDVIRVLEDHGLSRDTLARWAFAKGMDPGSFGITFGGEGAYTLYDDATLAALADQGDPWAQQTLANRIWKARPLEAADRYRDAAVRGSAQAAQDLASLYFYAAEALDRGRTGEWSEETVTALRQAGAADGGLEVTALAWSLAGEAEAGLPEGSLASFMLSDYTPADVATACRRAAGIIADNADQRSRLGHDPGWTGPAPLSLFPDPGVPAPVGCPEDLLPRPDFSRCEAVRVEMDNPDAVSPGRDGLTLRVCPNEG